MQAIAEFSKTHWDGYAVRDFLTSNADMAAYIAGGYLFFVFWGPGVIEKYGLTMGKLNPATGIREKSPIIKYAWILWNFFLSFFSLYGTLHVTPFTYNQVKTKGWRGGLCDLSADNFYNGPVGMAVGLFCLSKGPEFVDTFFIIISGKKNLPFLQWFHHVTTFLFCWHAYAVGSSAMYFAASLNYTVHTVMYFYFALAEMGLKKVVRPFAIYITTIQIIQMILGTTWIIMIIYYKLQDPLPASAAGGKNTINNKSNNNVNNNNKNALNNKAADAAHADGSGCVGTPWDAARVQLFIALANLVLFTDMFLKAYVFKKKKPSASAAAEVKEGGEKKKKN